MINSLRTNLRHLLLLDAATCVGMGAALMLAGGLVAPLMAIPADLLFYAGLSLIPIGAFMAVVARRQWPWAVWLVIVGNAGWTAASFMLLLGGWIQPNALGIAFITAQASVVAFLAALEFGALTRSAAYA